ncbi:metallophosphoesterase [Paenarthrobacter sp. DKR-5]|uniref:metallophosphoesterase n=1 Tax=Paenarthrobacter sp. DKR-5 TaxID=2835535 RepID=UPI001BDC207D|nr:metallophosphoesterase [Paenarthrobacter sp. DKR-5]MBT1001357.1 metallophosphoesterase [Paenarthrobacter sp. DKR-5]
MPSGLARLGRNLARVVGTGAAVGAACVAYGSLLERNAFTVREEAVPVLPAGSGPLRVLHLSDIHFVPGQNIKTRWLRGLAGLKPDLVVNTGDNLSHPDAIAPLLDALGPLLEVPGVFVPGSNDYYAPTFKNPASYLLGPSRMTGKEPQELDTARLHSGFGAAGWLDLTNRAGSMTLQGLRLDFTGVDDPHLRREKYAGWPAGGAKAAQSPQVKIAVAHAPYQRVLDRFTDDGAQLIFAGHTHGGQLCVPGYGALVSNCDLPTWRAKGLTRWEHGGRSSWLEVSGGIGTSRFAPVRFACRPEAVLLTLTPA